MLLRREPIKNCMYKNPFLPTKAMFILTKGICLNSCLPCAAYVTFRDIGKNISLKVDNYMNGVAENTSNDPSNEPNNTISINSQIVPPIQPSHSQILIPGSRTYNEDNPPDVQKLGSSSWTLLHAVTAKYPTKPTDFEKLQMQKFLMLFSHVYPCNWCAKDFEKFIEANSPRVESRDELGRWMCEAHNHVNNKLGKPKFDCNFWEKRWKDGWDE
ncbi:hypothetical protein NCAS_0A02000 [Naumovozyma castellii]|uniref:Sulfhydryl oxidase n=1 Tax=Naumovozyma castellii TaxID=27288 RepID=G0V5M0_NAUCA|nr:hypothetical protein NCAS_0A02000 [Naumovozyma castellii CBS 4309]CCC66758.1 hypothetical protein NCAS_0A02000 [Naumovozyma castellii CBS 4309]